MKKMVILSALVLGTSLALGSGALAKGPKFETLDQNKDGQITQDEIQQAAQMRFAKADQDGDGMLSKAELEAAAAERAQKRVARMLERHDANKDGVLSPDEMDRSDKMARMFKRLDKDNSGGVSAQEFKAARGHHKGQHGGKAHRDAPQD